MSADNTIPTPATTDSNGTVQPVGTVPSATATPTPATAGAQPGDNSNQPDAQTPAAASMPSALVNNPQVESQKLATQVDANKNSPSPFHTMLRHAAIEMLGGQQYKTDYKPDGAAVRTPIEPSLAHLGLALAAEVLKGGLAGGNAKDTVAAAQAGQAQVAKDQAARKQAELNQDAQAKADQNHKLAVTETNLRTHLLAQQVGASDKAISQTLSDAYKPLTDGLMDGTITANVDKPVFESDAVASIQNGKTNVTKDLLLPVGDPQPVMENGVQKSLNGVPLWGHNYIVVHNTAQLQTTLTDDMKQKLQSIGYFRNPDGSSADIGNPQWSFADLSKKMSEYAAVQAGEAMLNQHLNDAHDYLGTDEKDVPKLKDLATEVRNDPNMRKAIQTFSRFGGTMPLDVILYNLNQADPQSASRIMQYMHLTPRMLGEIATAREAEESKAKKVTAPLQPDTVGKAAAIYNDPSSTPAQKKQASGVLDFFDKQEQDKAQTAVNKAESIADAKQNSKDRRTPVYVDTPDGLVYSDRYTAEHSMGASSNAIEEMKPSDLVKDKTAMRQLTDVQMNTSRYTQAIANDLPKVTEQDRDRMREIQALNSQNGGNLVSLGQGGLSLNIPVVSAKLSKANYKQLSDDLNNLSAPAKNVMNAYLRTAAAVPAYQKALTGIGRSNKEMLDLELANVPMPYFDAATASERMQAFQENIDRAGKGFPNNLPGMQHPSSVRASMETPTAKTVKFQGQQLPVNADGTITYQGHNYRMNPDGKGATIVAPVQQ